MLFISALLIALAAGAAIIDLRSAKIPNLLLIEGACLLLPARMYFDSPEALLGGALCGLVTVCGLFPFFCLRALGAGDIKLLGLLCLGLSPKKTAVLVLASFLIGAIGGLLLIAFAGGKRKSKVHFAPAVFLGLLTALFPIS